MILQRLEIKRFGNFEDYSISFKEGLNVIAGSNESGKSTLINALVTILFEDPASEKKTLRSLQNWNAEHPYLLYLEYQVNDKCYKLTKDFSTQILQLEEVESGNKWNDKKQVQKKLAEALGFSEAGFFLGSALIKQDELDGVNSATEIIKDKLEGLVTSGKEDLLASRILERLQKRSKEINKKGSKNLGEVQQIEAEIQSWRYDYDINRRKMNEMIQIRKQLHTLNVDCDQTKKNFDNKHELFRKSKLAFEAEQNLNKEKDTFLDLGRRVRNAQEIRENTAERKDKLKSLIKIERRDLKSSESLNTQKWLYENRVEDCINRLENENETAASAAPKAWSKILTFAAFAGMFISSYLWKTSADMVFLGAGAAMGTILLISLVTWFTSSRNQKLVTTRVNEAGRLLEEEKSNLSKCTDTLKDILSKYEVEDVDEMAEAYEIYRDLEKEIKSLVENYESLLASNNLKDIEDDLALLSDRMNKEQETYNKFRTYSLAPEKLEQLQREVADLDKKNRALEEERQKLDYKQQFIESGSDSLASLEERIEEGEIHLKRLNHESSVLEIIFSTIEEARQKVLKTSIDILEEKASGFLQLLSDGQWQQIRFDRDTLACEVSADGEKWYDPNTSLSRSTTDALYFAIRIALVKVVSGDCKPPIIMEDPFVFFDHNRRQKSADFITELANEYQVLLLTPHRWYQNLAANQLALDEICQQQPGSPISV